MRRVVKVCAVLGVAACVAGIVISIVQDNTSAALWAAIALIYAVGNISHLLEK